MIKDAKALIKGENKIYISWNNVSEGYVPTFKISKSLIPLEDQFTEIATGIDVNNYLDEANENFYFKNVEFYYIIKEYNDLELIDSKMVCVGKSLNEKIPLAIMRKKEKLFKRKLKNDCQIFIKSPAIEPCPVCWDFTYNESKDKNCQTCGGSGRMNMYLPPLDLFYNQGKSYITTRKTKTTEVEPHSKNVEVYGYHKIKSGDIFKDKSNELWRVDNNSIDHYHLDYSQMLLVKKLDRDEPEYRILFKEV